jgi:hypothetical protein
MLTEPRPLRSVRWSQYPPDRLSASECGDPKARGGLLLPSAILRDTRIMDERELMRRWVEAWKEAGPVLDAIRRQEIRQDDNLKVLALLECAFNQVVREMPLRPSSGLVEMQSWFAKLGR